MATPSMDAVTQQVKEMYTEFPYPYRGASEKPLTDLFNVLNNFGKLTGFSFENKKMLDGGCGTGHRISGVARGFPTAKILGVDMTTASLEIARGNAKKNGIANISFQEANLLDLSNVSGPFDVVTSMGVIHHLSDPPLGIRNLVSKLADHGFIFTYYYGDLGSVDRMRKKSIIHMLAGPAEDMKGKVAIAEELAFELAEYGWVMPYDANDRESRASALVDRFLHVNELLYKFETLYDLFQQGGCAGMTIFVVTIAEKGLFVDTRLEPKDKFGEMSNLIKTGLPDIKKSKLLREKYETLSLDEKLKLIDLFYLPNGYTVIGWPKKKLPPPLDSSDYLQKNTVWFS